MYEQIHIVLFFFFFTEFQTLVKTAQHASVFFLGIWKPVTVKKRTF